MNEIMLSIIFVAVLFIIFSFMLIYLLVFAKNHVFCTNYRDSTYIGYPIWKNKQEACSELNMTPVFVSEEQFLSNTVNSEKK